MGSGLVSHATKLVQFLEDASKAIVLVPNYHFVSQPLAVGYKFRPDRLYGFGEVFRMLFPESVENTNEKLMVQAGGRFFFRFWLPATFSRIFSLWLKGRLL
jgi:hypothetical protein